MAQNNFLAPYTPEEQLQNAQQRRQRQPVISGPQGAGFGASPDAAGMPIAAPEMGQGAAAGGSPLSSYPPPASASYSGSGVDQSPRAFGTGFAGEMPNLAAEAQSRWKSRGIDFDGLLKAGIAKSVQDESIGQDFWQRQQAADLNSKYIDAAGAAARPAQVGRTQDVDILQQLVTARSFMPPAERASIDASINQLMAKLGLPPISSTNSTPATNPGTAGSATGAPVPAGGLKAFASGFGPSAGAVGLPMALQRFTSAIPNPWVKGAAVIGSSLLGNYLGDKAVDAIVPDNDQAAAQHPMAQAAGFGVGAAMPFAARFAANSDKVRNSLGFMPKGGQTATAEAPASTAPTAPAAPVDNARFYGQQSGPAMDYAQGVPRSNRLPPPGGFPVQQQPIDVQALNMTPQITGFGSQPATPKFRAGMGHTPKVKNPQGK